MSANMKAKMVMVEGALATAEKVCAYYKLGDQHKQVEGQVS